MGHKIFPERYVKELEVLCGVINLISLQGIGEDLIVIGGVTKFDPLSGFKEVYDTSSIKI